MKWNISALLVFLLFAGTSLISMPGCIGAQDAWMGSVDAVFRYRTAEHSTIIYEVKPGSFSEEAGLKPGDVLLAIDGQDVTNATYEGVRAALRGPVGTEAVLTVKRGAKIIEIAVERRSASVEKGYQEPGGTDRYRAQ